MRIAVCEDNRADLASICRYIEDYCQRSAFSCDIHTFETAEALLAAAGERLFEAIFLDVYLPGISGVEAARRLRKLLPSCALVFITVSPDHALEGYELSAGAYVLKPIGPEGMARALESCRREFMERSRVLQVNAPGGGTELALSRLRYAEVYDKSVLFHMESGVVESRITLDEVERRLNGSPFLRCHRSYIVNMNYVAQSDERGFVMEGGDHVPVRRNGGREVRLALARFVSGHKSGEG